MAVAVILVVAAFRVVVAAQVAAALPDLGRNVIAGNQSCITDGF